MEGYLQYTELTKETNPEYVKTLQVKTKQNKTEKLKKQTMPFLMGKLFQPAPYNRGEPTGT